MRIFTLSFSSFATVQRPLRRAVGRSWLAGLLLLTGPTAFAQLSGAYTINNAQPTGGTNYASFTAAAVALTAGGVSGAVTFMVSGGPYTEQLILNPFAGASAASRVTFDGGGRTIQFGAGTAALPAVVTLNGADYVTLNNLRVDATVGGTSTAANGWGIQVVNNSDNCVISNCNVLANTTSTTLSYAGIVSGGSAASPTAPGPAASQNLTITGNTITGGYYGLSVVGVGSAVPSSFYTPGVVISNNVVRDFYSNGIYFQNLVSPLVSGNDIARPTRTVIYAFYGLYLAGCIGATVEKNRIHNSFTAARSTNRVAYGLLVSTDSSPISVPNVVSNNLIYNMDGSGDIIGLSNGVSFDTRYYYNTVLLDDQTYTGSGNTWGYNQSAGNGVLFKNNVMQVTRTGTGDNYAMRVGTGFASPLGSELVSDYNDLVVGSGSNFAIAAASGINTFRTLADWRAAARAPDMHSVSVLPQVLSTTTGNLQPTAAALNGAATPLAQVTTDFTGAPRSTTAPDIGAYEFNPVLATRSFLDSPALAVFPNPSATGQLTLRLPVPIGPGSVELLNTLGQVMRQQLTSGSDFVVSTQGLAAGLYTLRVQAGGSSWTRRVVLQ